MAVATFRPLHVAIGLTGLTGIVACSDRLDWADGIVASLRGFWRASPRLLLSIVGLSMVAGCLLPAFTLASGALVEAVRNGSSMTDRPSTRCLSTLRKRRDYAAVSGAITVLVSIGFQPSASRITSWSWLTVA
jgi:hypothetical protein